MRVSKGDADKADLASERVLLEVLLPYWNHHSGNLVFGPDGMLYIAIGDGGGKPGGDPLRWAQNLFVLNAKILRIDVDKKAAPANTAFRRTILCRQGSGTRGGLRLWHAESVGVELRRRGHAVVRGCRAGFVGGDQPHRKGRKLRLELTARASEIRAARRGAAAARARLFAIRFSLMITPKGLSITGGFVYRGSMLPRLEGRLHLRRLGFRPHRALRYDRRSRKVFAARQTLLQPPLDAKGKTAMFQPTAFIEDADHEILALDWNGKIFRWCRRSSDI